MLAPPPVGVEGAAVFASSYVFAEPAAVGCIGAAGPPRGAGRALAAPDSVGAAALTDAVDEVLGVDAGGAAFAFTVGSALGVMCAVGTGACFTSRT